MDEKLLKSVDVLIPETDSSDSDTSSEIHSSHHNEVIVSATSSESDDDDPIPSADNETVLHASELNESENIERSINENNITIDEKFSISKSQSQNSIQSCAIRNLLENFPQIVSRSQDSESHFSRSNDITISETDSNDGESGKSPEFGLEEKSEMCIPETPLQSDQEDDSIQSNELNVFSSQISNSPLNQSSSQSQPQFSEIFQLSNGTDEQSRLSLENNFHEHEYNPCSNSQQNCSPNEIEEIISETSSDETNNQNSSIENVIIYETESSDNENSQKSEIIIENNEVYIPETPSGSDEEETSSVHSENALHQTTNQNISAIIQPLNVVQGNLQHSPELFDDENPNSSLNIAEVDTEDIEIPPSTEDDFPFIIPESLGRGNDNEPTVPINVQNPHESVRDDDDETILNGEDPKIEISTRSQTIIERIERFILGVLNDVRNGKKIEIVVQNRHDWSNCFLENERFMLLPITEARCRHIKSTYNLALIFYMLGEIHEILLNNRTCTIRELYYKNVNVTQKQENINEALKTICCILDAMPWELGVLSTSKGLIVGPLQLHLPNNVVIDCNIDKNGITLPHLTAGIVDISTTAKHILLVEKDTVFKKLLQNNIIERWNNLCIVITGKGYPDTNTRLILTKLRELHELPINVFTDADPYGIEIMLTYRNGSLSMSNLAEALAIPSIRWLGIFPSDIRKYGIAAVPLTADDQRKLDNILNRPFINDHVHRELLIMKQANLKAEIEGISNSNCTYLIDVYLRNKIDNNDGI